MGDGLVGPVDMLEFARDEILEIVDRELPRAAMEEQEDENSSSEEKNNQDHHNRKKKTQSPQSASDSSHELNE